MEIGAAQGFEGVADGLSEKNAAHQGKKSCFSLQGLAFEDAPSFKSPKSQSQAELMQPSLVKRTEGSEALRGWSGLSSSSGPMG